MPSPESSAALTMRVGESIRFAVQALAADKVKASLTMLGVVIASAALVLVVAICSTGKVYIVSQIEGIGSNLAYATLDRTKSFSDLDDELTAGDLTAVQDLHVVEAAAGTYDTPVDFQLRNRMFHARLVGVTQDFEKIRRLRITNGRYFDTQDYLNHFKVCLVTDQLAGLSFGVDSAVGSVITMDQFRCSVIGTFREGVATFGQSEIQGETVLIPFPLVRESTGDNFFQVLYAQAASSDEVEAMTRQMEHVLHSRHREEARYTVDNLSSLLHIVNLVSITMSAILLAISVLTMFTAGTGIMNIMLVNVSQRIHEIGLRKALGARPAEIRLQFLLEACFISVAGGVVGVVTAIGIVLLVTNLVKDTVPFGIPWMAAVVALLVSSVVGVLFGYRPASEAASLSPIDALRVE
jgi:putative ABC transport system permease protein